MILQLRGICGSGKSYAILHFLDKYAPCISIDDSDRHTTATVVMRNMVPVFCIGPYKHTRACGCDKVDTQDLISSYIRHYSQFGHVIFEGFYISAHFPRYYALYKELTQLNMPFVIAELDTSFDECMERMVARRLEKSKTKDVNIEGLNRQYRYVANAKQHFADIGIVWRTIRHNDDVVQQVESILDEDNAYDFKNSYVEEKF